MLKTMESRLMSQSEEHKQLLDDLNAQHEGAVEDLKNINDTRVAQFEE